MNNRPLISLCIPTNGVIHWVFPVLDSIYAQGVEERKFEVVVCDNGHNVEFKEKIRAYRDKHQNFIYAETDAPVFLSEPETYKLASGELIKFINHRTMLREGTLKYYLDFVCRNQDKNEKPIIFFSNGELNGGGVEKFSSFNEFARNLRIYSTWSTGITIWKEDFDRLPSDTVFNELFPHTTILFHERQRHTYIIDDMLLLDELSVGKTAKGSYDVFNAFAVEYMYILLGLLRDKDITIQTFLCLKGEIKRFCADLYIDFILLKKPCSYDLKGFCEAVEVFFNKRTFKVYSYFRVLYRCYRKIRRMLIC